LKKKGEVISFYLLVWAVCILFSYLVAIGPALLLGKHLALYHPGIVVCGFSFALAFVYFAASTNLTEGLERKKKWWTRILAVIGIGSTAISVLLSMIFIDAFASISQSHVAMSITTSEAPRFMFLLLAPLFLSLLYYVFIQRRGQIKKGFVLIREDESVIYPGETIKLDLDTSSKKLCVLKEYCDKTWVIPAECQDGVFNLEIKALIHLHLDSAQSRHITKININGLWDEVSNNLKQFLRVATTKSIGQLISELKKTEVWNFTIQEFPVSWHCGASKFEIISRTNPSTT
jgi:hypothetical protein